MTKDQQDIIVCLSVKTLQTREELAKMTELPLKQIYPILTRMIAAGVLDTQVGDDRVARYFLVAKDPTLH